LSKSDCEVGKEKSPCLSGSAEGWGFANTD